MAETMNKEEVVEVLEDIIQGITQRLRRTDGLSEIDVQMFSAISDNIAIIIPEIERTDFK